MDQQLQQEYFNWSNKIHLPKLRSFHNTIIQYCKKLGLDETFENFLEHSFNGIISDTYQQLYTAPKAYLANSKAFMNFYNKIDYDFQRDIITRQEIKELQEYLMENDLLKRELKKLMGRDSRL